MTGGMSMVATNNRGVVYCTVVGETTGVQTFTTRNPDGLVLNDLRSLKAAADAVLRNPIAAAPPETAPEPAPTSPSAGTSSSGAEVVRQLQQLADLHLAGTLSREEFQSAKDRLLAD